MRLARVIRQRLRSLFRHSQVETISNGNSRSTWSNSLREYRSAGMSERDATDAARRAFGALAVTADSAATPAVSVRWKTSAKISSTPRGCSPNPPALPPPPCCRWLSAWARIRPSSRLVKQVILDLLPVRDPNQIVAIAKTSIQLPGPSRVLLQPLPARPSVLRQPPVRWLSGLRPPGPDRHAGRVRGGARLHRLSPPPITTTSRPTNRSGRASSRYVTSPPNAPSSAEGRYWCMVPVAITNARPRTRVVPTSTHRSARSTCVTGRESRSRSPRITVACSNESRNLGPSPIDPTAMFRTECGISTSWPPGCSPASNTTVSSSMSKHSSAQSRLRCLRRR